MTKQKEKALIFEMSKPGRVAYSLPELDVPEVDVAEVIPDSFLRQQPRRNCPKCLSFS